MAARVGGRTAIVGKSAALRLVTGSPGGPTPPSLTTSGILPFNIDCVVGPTITAQPISQTVPQGTPVALSVTATFCPTVSYQWRKDGSDLIGQNNATLSFPAVQPADAGGYSVVLSNLAGVVTSEVATLSVAGTPVITRQPASQTVFAGTNVSFSVEATGTGPLSYQWYFNATNLLAGQTGSTLALENVQPAQAGAYSVTVANGSGTATSDPAILQVVESALGIQMYTGLKITGIVGRTYVLSQTADLIATNSWMPIATNTFTTPDWLYLDTNSPASQPRKFYRVDMVR